VSKQVVARREMTDKWEQSRGSVTSAFLDDGYGVSSRRRTPQPTRHFRAPPPLEKDEEPEDVVSEPANIRNHKRCLTNCTAFLIVVVLMLLGLGGLAWTNYMTPPEPFVPLNITKYMPSLRCYRVSKKEIEESRTDKKWLHLKESMTHSIETMDLNGISAFHLGQAACYMIIRLEGGSYLEMFNVDFIGYGTVMVRRDEVSSECPEIVRSMTRADTVLVTYNEDTRSELMTVALQGQAAWTAQSIGFYQEGKTICDMNRPNTDKGIETLRTAVQAHIT
jgi:hypothetical protein